MGWAGLVLLRQQLLPRQVPELPFLPSLDEQPASWPLFSLISQGCPSNKSKGTWEGNRQAKVEVSEPVGSRYICVVLKFSTRCNFLKNAQGWVWRGTWLRLSLPGLPGGCPVEDKTIHVGATLSPNCNVGSSEERLGSALSEAR